MRTYKVIGAHADTGEDVTARINAADEREAEAVASHRRIMVSRIIEVEAPAPPAKAHPTTAPRKRGGPVCQLCGGDMKKHVQSSGNCLGIAIALVMLATGIILTFTVALAIIGIPLCIVALFIGGKRTKVWRCKSCGAIVQRA